MIEFDCQKSQRAGISGTINKLMSYTGDYVVTPKLNGEIVLETKGKKMTDNVIVKEIPISKIVNPNGGITLKIGG